MAYIIKQESIKNKNWHSLGIEKTLEILETSLEKGLTEIEAKNRFKLFGKNKLPEEKALTGIKIFFNQFKSPLIYILVLAGLITIFLKDYTDAAVIFGAVFINVIIGYFQENKASRILKSLKKAVIHPAIVLRDGNLKIIDSENLVPGDIIILKQGAKVPADARIIKCYEFKTNEMVLTGEWLPANKKSGIISLETPLADRDNMVYMGTIIEKGKAEAMVTATGINTEIGKIAKIIQETEEEKTPYQKKIIKFSKLISLVIVFVCLIIFIKGVFQTGKFAEMLVAAVAVAVAAIPEGLPVAITVILALGMQRILKNRGLVKKMISTETLGSTSVICTDKTGTLTKGKMELDEIIARPARLRPGEVGRGDKLLALKTASITNEAFVENIDEQKENWIIRGEATDRALLKACLDAGLEYKKFEKNKIFEFPFDSVKKYAAAVCQEDKKKILYVSGAPEVIIQKCVFKNNEKALLEKQLEEFAGEGLRVVATACKEIQNSKFKSQKLIEEIQNLVFAGLITLRDPLREGAKEAMIICQKAGIKPIIATGDHKLTAKAIAEELEMEINDENIITGPELDKISNEKLSEILEKIKIYARVEPIHKMRIIEAWQKRGEVVAMTGDGINDAPALKKADIGVALGSGTEVAKEASDLMLLDDNFSVIIAAVQEGRVILDNIRKVVTYLLAGSFTEIILVGTSIFLGLPLPILATQILWVNLIEDGLPAMALAFEPKEKDIMKLKPAGHDIPLLTKEMKLIIFFIGILTNIILLGIFFKLLYIYPLDYLRTMIFAMLAIDSISYIFCCKSLRKNIWQINIFDNKILLGGWVFSLAALLAAIYIPALNILLKTVPLAFLDWWLIIGLGIINIILIEMAKWYFIIKTPFSSKLQRTNRF